MTSQCTWQFLAVRNFRDFGGSPALNGRMVRSGRLFRSASLGDATDSDIRILDGIGIECQLDLRQPHERRAKPNRWPSAGVEVICGEADGFQGGDLLREAAFFELVRCGNLTVGAARARMLDVYAATAFDPSMVALYRAWFQRLASLERAVLVHCAAGKDRTGLLCALTLHALGVDEDHVFADYEKTNAGDFVVQRVAETQEKLLEATGAHAPADVLEAFLRADPDYLRHAFTMMAERHGSVSGYLDAVLDVDAALVERLHERLLDQG